MKAGFSTPSPLSIWAAPGAATWLRPFRSRLNLSGVNLAVYCQLDDKTPTGDDLIQAINCLIRSGWLAPIEPSGTYRIHPALHFKLPPMKEAEQVYVLFFQYLGSQWPGKGEYEGSAMRKNTFPADELPNIEHALALALETHAPIEHLVWCLYHGYQIAFTRGRLIQRLEQIVARLEHKVSIAMNDTITFDLLSSLDLLANTCKTDKQFDRAEQFYLQVVEFCEALQSMAVFSNQAANSTLYQSALATALIRLAELCRERGDFDCSRGYWEKASILAAQADLAPLNAHLLCEAGLWHKAQRQYVDSELQLRKALELSNDAYTKGLTMVNLAALADQRGDKAESIAMNKTAFELLEPYGIQAPLGATFINMGLAYVSLGDWKSGEQYAHRAIEWFYAQGDWLSIAECYQNLGNLSFDQRDLIFAQEYFKKAREAFQRANLPLLTAEILQNETEVLRLLGNLDAAQKAAESAVAIFHQKGYMEGEASAILNGANVLLQKEELEQAFAAYQKALGLFEKTNGIEGQGLVHQNMAEIARRFGDYDEGSRHLMKATILLTQPEAREHLPRLIAYANVFADCFQNKEILNQMAERLNELLDEATLLRVLEQARTQFKIMHEE
jgi:tetratricopeptide (TPR) repeat protein